MTPPQDPFSTPDPNAPQQQPAGFGSPPPAYGAPAYGSAYPGPHQSPKNGMGIAALVLGVLSLFSWFLLIGGLLGLVAVLLGFLARGKVKRGEATNGGMALAGIITGVIGLLLTVAVVAGVAALFNSGEFSNLTECLQDAAGDQEAIDECSRQFEDSVSGLAG